MFLQLFAPRKFNKKRFKDMSKGHPYRYDQGHYDRNRSRFGQDGRRDLVPPYKRQRRSSGNDFTTFSYDDCNQEVGLGSFNDFSAIKRETILPRDRRHESKPPSSQSTLTVQTTRSNTASKSPSKISPLSVNISPSSHGSSKLQTSITPSSASSSLLSSFQRPSPQLTTRSQPTSPYQPATISQHNSRVEPNQSPGHSLPSVYLGTKPDQPGTGLLMQASCSDVNSPNHVKSNTDTSKKEEVYQPKVEAVSPTNSEAEVEKASVEPMEEVDQKKRSDELLKQMEKVDKEISEVEKKINDLKDKQKTLEDELSQDALQVEEEEEEEKENENTTLDNGIEEKMEVETPPPEPKEKALIERIYEENRKKAAAAHERFAKIGIPLPTALPLYNQPSDLPFYEENRKKARAVQLKLVKYFQRKRKDKQIKQRALLEQYRVLHKKWMEKVEKIQNNQKRKNREGKIRDSYEKIFPEIKRHREQTERFSRIGSRNWGMSARSDAEYEEILKDLEEKERHEKHMRLLAVDPPPLLDEDQRRVKYINRNGLIKDLQVYVEQHKMLNIWTEREKEIFKEKYIVAPKDFEFIAKFIPNKNVKDCILHYYLTKRKTGNYKKLAKKQSLKRKRLTHSTIKDETSKSKILKPRTEGSRSESDVEEEEGFDIDSDGSEESSSRLPITSSNTPAKITTPQTANKTAGTEPASVETPRWSKSEREIAIEGLRRHGRNWTAISQMVKTKTEAQCKNFYFNYKRKLDLENVIAEHNAAKVVQRRESEETISASEAPTTTTKSKSDRVLYEANRIQEKLVLKLLSDAQSPDPLSAFRAAHEILVTNPPKGNLHEALQKICQISNFMRRKTKKRLINQR
ncbi:nuclear receptor corepressor 1-like [Dendronephthya gigantea]|uniref:nuclear receptor corepressor 1-like n=1 Tax=Dendronephthya gigantea TaxID=151771 RepID=UPI00106CF63B|nr:nuclear receptor corepressor 1-like [Dendronephthya gigantea]